MKKFIGYIFETIVICIAMIIITFYGIVGFPKDVFSTSYQSVIQDKFRLLKETNTPKIIIVAGSNGAFGIDQHMLEEATGYKVVNLGLHAGFRHLFYTELSKANINPGDIVLLAYEHNWDDEVQFTSIGTDLVMTGIDSNIEMYKYMPMEVWPSILGNLGKHAYAKNTFQPAEGQYSREAFDSQTGQMVFTRNYNMSEHRENIEKNYFSDRHLSNETVRYLKEYKCYVEKKGAEVYFVSPPMLREAVADDICAVANLASLEEELIGIPYISDPLDYLYPETLMADGYYHCNDRGAEERTRQLINDLNDAGIVTVNNIEDYRQSKNIQILFEYDLEKYLEAINDTNYTIFISIKDEGTSELTGNIIKAMKTLGLQINLMDRYRNSYYAVISSDGIIEKVSDKQLETKGVITCTGVEYSIISAGHDCGNESSIIIDNVEYSRNLRGLNIVVYDNEKAEVIDTVCFDMFDGVSVSR